MNPGVYHRLPMADYLAAPGTSKTALDWLHRSPLDYSEYISGKLVEKTPEMTLGTILHSAILEGKKDFVMRPDTYGEGKKWNGNATECKQWLAAQVQPVLSREDAELALKSMHLVRADPLASKLLVKGEAECSLFAQDQNGRLLKGRPDWAAEDYFVDLKSTTDATTNEFSREIYTRRYHVQAALYLRLAELLGMPQKRWFFIILQKGERPRLNVRELHESALDLGRCELDDDLALLTQCEAAGFWAGYSGDSGHIEKIDVPAWAHAKAAAEFELTMGGKRTVF